MFNEVSLATHFPGRESGASSVESPPPAHVIWRPYPKTKHVVPGTRRAANSTEMFGDVVEVVSEAVVGLPG